MKAILVMDMPSSCEECNFHQYGICHAVRKCITGTPKGLKEKPDWCPLKPMPQRANHPDWCDGGRYDKGYNACIDEIMKGVEENG